MVHSLIYIFLTRISCNSYDIGLFSTSTKGLEISSGSEVGFVLMLMHHWYNPKQVGLGCKFVSFFDKQIGLKCSGSGKGLELIACLFFFNNHMSIKSADTGH